METKEQWADTNRARSTRSPARLAVIVFIVAAGVLLILEHRAHVLGYWPLLLLAACIGSHFFMHRGHGKGGGHALATTGPYARVRHPQYAGFALVMLGFIFQWPTLLTLAMFPVLIWMYARLARSEEREAMAEFGDAYRRYSEAVPAFTPRWARPAGVEPDHG